MSRKRATPELPILTRAESEVMRALWTTGPATVATLREQMGGKAAYTTVLTMVKILEKKGYVTRTEDPAGGRAHLYSAAVPEQRTRKTHVRDLVDRLFGGRMESLVTGLLDSEELDEATLKELREQIDAQLRSGDKPPRKGRP